MKVGDRGQMQADDISRGAGSTRAAGARVPLLSPSSLLAAKHRLETQYLVVFFFFCHSDLVVTILGSWTFITARSFSCPGKGAVSPAQPLLILPPWGMLSPLPLPAEHSPGFSGHDLSCEEYSLCSAALLGRRGDAVTLFLPCFLPQEPEDPSSTIQSGSPRF